MKVAIGADHGGVHLKATIKALLDELNVAYTDFGTDSEDSVDYPDIAEPVAKAVAAGEYDRGILICGTGIGISIAANRYHGIRAAVLYDDDVARLAHEHNNANVVVFGGRTMAVEDCIRRFDIFMNAKYEGGRHDRRLEKIEQGGCR